MINERNFGEQQRIIKTQREDGPTFIKQIKRGEDLVRHLAQMQSELRNINASRPKKIELMKEWISKGQYHHLTSLSSLPLPLAPAVEVISVTPQRSTIFKSAMTPLAVSFTTKDSREFSVRLFF